MATINLAPGSQYIAALRRRRRTLLSLSGAVVALLLIVGVGLAIMKQSASQKLSATQSELRSVETQIAQLADDVRRINLFEERLTSLDTLLAHHITWTPLLKDVERLLPAPVTLSQITANSTDAVLIVNAATGNIDDIAQTLASLSTSTGHPTLFKSANLKNIARKDAIGADGQAQASQYLFQAKFSFDPQVLTSGK